MLGALANCSRSLTLVGEREAIPLINLAITHGQTLAEAQRHLETAVQRVHNQFTAFVRQVTWSADRTQVRLEGVGFWLELWVDAHEVHATGDVPLLGVLLGGRTVTGLQRILEESFHPKRP
jgi:hypothetical protein